MYNNIPDRYIKMLLQSRLNIIEPMLMDSDEINEILESCLPLYEHLSQKEIENEKS